MRRSRGLVTAASRLKITPIGLTDLWKGGKREQEIKYHGKRKLAPCFLIFSVYVSFLTVYFILSIKHVSRAEMKVEGM
jgi:hypothetical protein